MIPRDAQLATESAALEADESDRAEMHCVANLMEPLHGCLGQITRDP